MEICFFFPLAVGFCECDLYYYYPKCWVIEKAVLDFSMSHFLKVPSMFVYFIPQFRNACCHKAAPFKQFSFLVFHFIPAKLLAGNQTPAQIPFSWNILLCTHTFNSMCVIRL